MGKSTEENRKTSPICGFSTEITEPGNKHIIFGRRAFKQKIQTCLYAAKAKKLSFSFPAL
jgi:hypothetical protein